jgi:3-oxoacyl-[acyl-carrier protein] reductase
MSVHEKVALVTGASRGIGKAIALALARQSDVMIVGSATTETGAESITAYLQEAGVKGQGVVLDIGNSTSIDALLEWFSKSLLKMPSILVNNAGVTSDNLFLRMKREEWEKVINTNLTGTYHLIHGCIRSMVKQRFGRIVSISSVVGVTGNPGQANYAASKAGVIGLTKSLAREVGSRGITVNVVAPGFIDTDMTRKLSEEQHTKLVEQIPLGRMGSPEEIASAVAFLVSTEAGYITGETLHVNGGMHMC